MGEHQNKFVCVQIYCHFVYSLVPPNSRYNSLLYSTAFTKLVVWQLVTSPIFNGGRVLVYLIVELQPLVAGFCPKGVVFECAVFTVGTLVFIFTFVSHCQSSYCLFLLISSFNSFVTWISCLIKSFR